MNNPAHIPGRLLFTPFFTNCPCPKNPFHHKGKQASQLPGSVLFKRGKFTLSHSGQDGRHLRTNAGFSEYLLASWDLAWYGCHYRFASGKSYPSHTPAGVERHHVCPRKLDIITPTRSNLFDGSDLNTMVTSADQPIKSTSPHASTTGGTFFATSRRRPLFSRFLSPCELSPFLPPISASVFTTRDKRTSFRRQRWRTAKLYISTGLTGYLRFS